ncbi:MAG: 6-phosphofructokinase [Calditrichaceae bacterium]
MMKKIGVLTGGGDCPGLNAVIRAVVKTAINDYGISVVGIEDGFDGLVKNRVKNLDYETVSGILSVGGTILGSSNRADPFAYVEEQNGKMSEKVDRSDEAVDNFKKRGLDALVCTGGDGTMSIAHGLMAKGIPVIGVPKTIDNDLYGTDVTFGFDSAVQIVSEAIDRLHTTAQSHHRVMVIETMGRYAGWLALTGGVAGGGDIILIPEIPYSLDAIADRVKFRSKRGKRFSIVVVAEGVKLPGGEYKIDHRDEASHDPVRLGGIGVWIARQIEEMTGISSRATILGHLQRGGSPTAYDRVLATRFGREAMKIAYEGEFGVMVGLRGDAIKTTPLEKIANRQRLVTPDSPIIMAAKSVGTSFGE